jgi:hypothetical protein
MSRKDDVESLQAVLTWAYAKKNEYEKLTEDAYKKELEGSDERDSQFFEGIATGLGSAIIHIEAAIDTLNRR